MKGGTNTYPRWDQSVTDWDEKPEPALVWQVIGGHAFYWALVAAVRLKVFERLVEGPRRLDDLSADLGIPEDRMGLLCDSLVAMSLLEGDRFGYWLNKTSRVLLVADSDRYLGDLVLTSPGRVENWPQLDTTLRGAVPPHDVDGDEGGFYRVLAHASFLTQLRAARLAAAKLGPVGRVLDLGAGGAPWTIAFLENNPQATAVIVELPAVLEVAQERCEAFGISGRCQLIAGDYHEVELPEHDFDLAILGNVVRNETPDRAIFLLTRTHHWLDAGGRLLVAEYFLNDDHRGPPSALALGLAMVANTRKGSVYTAEATASLLKKVGFVNARLVETVKRSAVIVAERSV